MKNIAVLSASVRDGRLSHRVALYFEKYLTGRGLANVELLDLKAYDFPLFTERLALQKNPSEALLEFTDRFNRVDGLIIVSPVYNASFPASLKNVIDLYYKEWRRKVTAVVSVSSGAVPPIATAQQIQTLLLKMGALVAAPFGTVIQDESAFSPEGDATDPALMEKLSKPMLDELFWLIEKTQG